MNSLLECPDVSDRSVHLSKKPPDYQKSLMPKPQPGRLKLTLFNQLNSYNTHDNDLITRANNCSRRKKIFLSKNTKKNLETIQSMEKSASPKNERLKKILSRLTYKTKASLMIFAKNIKRRQFYSNINNIKPYHFEIIKDLSSFSQKKAAIPKNSKISSLHWFNKIMAPVLLLPLLSNITTHISTFKLRVLKFLRHNKNHLSPNSPFKVLWDLLLVLTTLIQLFTFSIEQSFQLDLDMRWFQYFLTASFYIDIFLSLNTKFFKEGVPVTNRILIMKHLVTKKFMSDLVPCLFLSFLSFNDDERNSWAFLNLILLVKIYKSKHLEGRTKELIISSKKEDAISQMVILILKILCWAHLIAVLWHFIAYASLKSNPETDSWLKHKDLLNTDWRLRYLFSMYWAITTMLTVGYGDVTPSNSNEMLYNILAMFVGCGIFGYTMNKIGDILSQYHSQNSHLEEQMNKVSFMLKGKKLPRETQNKIKRYLEFVWKQELREDPEHENFIMSKLSSELRNEIYLHTNVKYLKSIPALACLSEKTLITLARHMKKVCFSPEQFVYKEGEYENLNIYFVLAGNLKLVTSRDDKVMTIWRDYKKSDYFGEREVITGVARSQGIISTDFSTLFKLSRADLLQVLRKSPKEYEKFCEIKDRDILYDCYTQYETPCFSCGLNDHSLEQCEFLTFNPIKRAVVYNHIRRRKAKAKRYRRKKKRTNNALSQILLSSNAQDDFNRLYSDDNELMDLYYLYTLNDEERTDLMAEGAANKEINDDSSEERTRGFKETLTRMKTKDFLKRKKTKSFSNLQADEGVEGNKADVLYEESSEGSFKGTKVNNGSLNSFSHRLVKHEKCEGSSDDFSHLVKDGSQNKLPSDINENLGHRAYKSEKSWVTKSIRTQQKYPASSFALSKEANTNQTKGTSTQNHEIKDVKVPTPKQKVLGENLLMEAVKVYENYFPHNNITELYNYNIKSYFGLSPV